MENFYGFCSTCYLSLEAYTSTENTLLIQGCKVSFCLSRVQFIELIILSVKLRQKGLLDPGKGLARDNKGGQGKGFTRRFSSLLTIRGYSSPAMKNKEHNAFLKHNKREQMACMCGVAAHM